jgi:protein disulfide-isomerase
MNRLGPVVMAAMLGLAACQRSAEVPRAPAGVAAAATQATGTATSVAKVEGIEWFEGGVDAAFEAARAGQKHVFLYWGAEWCPPCFDLKAHVFPRADFQQALRQFVPVYLDGDAPGAQRIAEEFRVLGYPSVVVLTADRRELARISGGSDLDSYAGVLDLALQDAQPVDEVLHSLRADSKRRLDAAACRRLAWNDWSMWTGESAALAEALEVAAQRCPAESRAERDRLVVQAADLAATAEREAIEGGGRASPLLSGLVAQVESLLADPARSREAGNALLYVSDDLFVVARQLAPARSAELRQRYFTLLDAVEADERQSDTVRLLSAARRVQAAKALGDGEVPAEVAARARRTLQQFLARDYDANARAGIVNSASWVLSELGDDLQLRALLEEQMKRSRTPYYYMPDMADIEERAGNNAAALEWLERGYRESRGPATRFQWGTLYLQGLLRMAPEDAARIRAAVIEVLGELDGPDRLHARTRARVERLDALLAGWAEQTGNQAALGAIRQRWQQICAVQAQQEAHGCTKLLGAGPVTTSA